MTDPKYLKKQGELYAVISLTLTIHEDGHLEVVLEIESENRSDEMIHLNKSYRIPMKKGASNVQAYDLSNKKELTAFDNRKGGYVDIIFERNTILPPHQKFSWRVSYTTSEFEKKMAKDTCHSHSTSHFSLDPQRSYKKIPIQNHRVHLKAIYEKRRDKNGKPLPTTLTQQNTLNIRETIIGKEDYIECSLEPFDLARGEQVEFTFCRHERPASNTGVSLRVVPKFLVKAWVFATPPVQKAIEELIKLFIKKF
jgi:hypothetical protein